MQRFAAILLLDGPTPRGMNWPSVQHMRCDEEGWGMSSYASYLSGSSYRLRATSKIGEFARDGSLSAMFGDALAQA
jgi:hypothetical protein